uniref:ATP synthase subunit a n=1 Tax=Draconetta xenica TaxID=215391 RepID=A0A060NTK0_9TELE|nr:ATP synthase F0 subunit 6 [Draconetta xenica]BAO84685.1 ATPase subunit 6 [Draconetta xenica]
MTLSIFDQFASPFLLGLPLIGLALILPWILFPSASARWVNSRWTTLQSWFIRNFTNHIIQPLNMAGHKWALLITSLMMIIMSLNMLGHIPYSYTPTTQLSLNLGLAVPLWLMTVILGMRRQPIPSLAHFLPEGTPILLIPLLILIELISLMIRPLALGVRLTANLTAGHLLLRLIAYATHALVAFMPMLTTLLVTLLILLMLLEIAVAIIQSYVFVMLLTLYLQENV